MNAYVFMQTAPGRAASAMEAVVSRGLATRAVLVTGNWDVIAKIEDVEWDELGNLVPEKVGRVPGVVRTYTAPVIPTELAARLNPSNGIPIWPIEMNSALVFAATSGSVTETLQALHRIKAVKALALLAADWDLLIQIGGDSFEEVMTTVLRDIRAVPGIVRTSTSLILRGTEVRVPKARSKTPKRPAAGKKPPAKTTKAKAKRRK